MLRLLFITAGLAASLVAGNAPDTSTYSRPRAMQKYIRDTNIPFPKDNPYSKDRAELGRSLFFDPRLSGSRSISCASCHNPAFAWGDSLPKAVGTGTHELGRRTPTILNIAWAELLFWDGRANSLEEQALGPIGSAKEMNLPLAELPSRVSSIPGYRAMFDREFPGEGVSSATVAKALATFERTVVSGTSPFDRWIAGDASAISEHAKRGFDLFNTSANCSKCHSGWTFTDDGFHDVGLPSDDRGRAANLNLRAMQFAFKTPTLRNIDQRAPYMHDGSEESLAAVIDFYDKGGLRQRPSLAPEIQPLHLTSQDKSDLLEFLTTLTSVDAPAVVPTLPSN